MSAKKALIVDDSTVTRLMIKKIIGELPLDCEFTESDSADKAKDILNGISQLDFATIDQNMPGTLTGLELASIVKQKFPDAKVALITANIQDAIRNQAAAINIDFIEKPISPEKLTPFIKKV
ncbi:response regulator receiver domain protein [Leptospira ryugenii]|uniref:Response regulator receiver domain protein n=1 Tax=Leptospira ryugenii TaxID=1917863 RepID=A0A2P2E3N3_9LEPT|nr:response regulator [Leptospira ryugenii]GBF51502.1 response regulator receiver domain protein [Leptospira ryugenii]